MKNLELQDPSHREWDKLGCICQCQICIHACALLCKTCGFLMGFIGFATVSAIVSMPIDYYKSGQFLKERHQYLFVCSEENI